MTITKIGLGNIFGNGKSEVRDILPLEVSGY